ncbi:MAG: phosphoribosylamine--glycine ligase [Treponema sp.]|nr:phosphoribosylamine--glycine ligase [Treponema sp.]
MKVLIIGSGGREHALAWKLAQSNKVEKIYVAPGNGGTAGEEKTENLPLGGADPATAEGQAALVEFARKETIALTVVGPEAPLAAGIADRFRAAELAVAGPGEKAARLETSKAYAKSFMEKYGVRAAKSRNFTDFAQALAYTEQQTLPVVIKADGLASGKGVVIAASAAEAKQALSAFMKDGVLGAAGKSVVIEEYLAGLEVSVLAAVSVTSGGKPVIKPFISARDHKRRFEGGQGPNTGGMGAIAPVPDFTAALQKDFASAILAPTLKGMEAEKMDYRGFIFFGLMLQNRRCYLLEYNARLGDPETQAVLPLLDSDCAELCQAVADGNLADFPLKWKKGAVCAPVAAASGYPGTFRSGDPIAINKAGLEKTGAKLFVSGAQRGRGGSSGSGLHTSGGRVLTVSARGEHAEDARGKAYSALRFVNFDGMVFRTDIGTEVPAADKAEAAG